MGPAQFERSMEISALLGQVPGLEATTTGLTLIPPAQCDRPGQGILLSMVLAGTGHLIIKGYLLITPAQWNRRGQEVLRSTVLAETGHLIIKGYLLTAVQYGLGEI